MGQGYQDLEVTREMLWATEQFDEVTRLAWRLKYNGYQKSKAWDGKIEADCSDARFRDLKPQLVETIWNQFA